MSTLKASKAYIEALQSVDPLDSPAEGLVGNSGGVASIRTLIKQNNVLIALAIKNQEYLIKIKEDLQGLRTATGKLKGTEDPDLSKALEAVQAKLEKLSLGDSTGTSTVPKKKGAVYVFTDPLQILRREQEKLKS